MTRCTVADRSWVPTPYGFNIWVIPGRAVVAAVPLPELSGRSNPPGACLRYVIAYLTEHGSATCGQMEPTDGRFTPGTLSGCLASHKQLFVARERGRGGKVWRLRGQP